MKKCPKCGSVEISKPVYKTTNKMFTKFIEYLEYECKNCGYAETTPTKDSKENLTNA